LPPTSRSSGDWEWRAEPLELTLSRLTPPTPSTPSSWGALQEGLGCPRPSTPASFRGGFPASMLSAVTPWGVAARLCLIRQPVNQRPRHPVPLVLGVPSPQAGSTPHP